MLKSESSSDLFILKSTRWVATAAIFFLALMIGSVTPALAQDFSLQMGAFSPFAMNPGGSAQANITINPNPTFSGSVGLTLLLRQGLAAWIRACSCGASLPTRDLVPQANVIHPLPADVRAQAAIILAGIILHSRPETTL